MAIKVSTLLLRNTEVNFDSSPTLGGILNTNNFEITNGANSVVISGNSYPTGPGLNGQVLSTNGAGTLSWQSAGSSFVTLIGDVTGSGPGTVPTVLGNTSVVPSTYGSSSAVPVFTVNSQGRITSATNSSISITPAQAGLGNVTNSLQVINTGGTPSIQQGSGNPTPPSTLGAVYIDRNVTNGNGIYYFDGTTWRVVAQKLNLFSENSLAFITPVAQAPNSVAIGSGAETAPSAAESLAIGKQALARLPGGVVQASGRFSSNGDAQTGRYLLRGTTISTAPQELLVDGTNGTARLVLPDNSTWTFRITVTAHRTDLGDGHAGYTASGVIYRGSGAASTRVQGSPQKVVLAESNPVWDINIGADAINGSLRVTVTGENSKIIRWVALVETVEVTN